MLTYCIVLSMAWTMVDTSPRLDSAENLDCCRNELQIVMDGRDEKPKIKDCCSRRPNLPSLPTLPPRPTLPVIQQQSSLQQCKNSVTSLTTQVNALKSNLNSQRGVLVNIVPPVFRKPSQTELVSVTKRINGVLNKPSFGKRPSSGKKPSGVKPQVIPGIVPGKKEGRGKGIILGDRIMLN